MDLDFEEGLMTFKKNMVEPGRQFKDLTICSRIYNLAYTKDGYFSLFFIKEAEVRNTRFKGTDEWVDKSGWFEILAPELLTFDTVLFLFSSRMKLEETKNEFSFFRSLKQPLNAREWHHMCILYSVSNKNTGYVINGEIVANRTQSDEWANEDNFYTNLIFEPFQNVTAENGNPYKR